MGFKYFRDIMECWDEMLDEQGADSMIDELLDGDESILFFKKNGDIFAGGEDARIVFAKLKNPDVDDDDTPEGWAKEAKFTARNLCKQLNGDEASHLFTKSELKQIKIIDREDAFKELKAKADLLGVDNLDKSSGENLLMVISTDFQPSDEE